MTRVKSCDMPLSHVRTGRAGAEQDQSLRSFRLANMGGAASRATSKVQGDWRSHAPDGGAAFSS